MDGKVELHVEDGVVDIPQHVGNHGVSAHSHLQLPVLEEEDVDNGDDAGNVDKDEQRPCWHPSVDVKFGET